MQANVFNVFVRLSQKALDRSRAYYHPLSTNAANDSTALSEIAFAAMLREIDAFSAELRAAPLPSECATGASQQTQAPQHSPTIKIK